MALYFDDCDDIIVAMVRVGVELLDIDVRNHDLIVDYDYIDYDDKALAFAEHDGDAFSISINSRVYDSDTDMSVVIAHELIHIKQYQTGRLKDKGSLTIEWEGEDHIFNFNDYASQPWEKEAYGAQEVLGHRINNRI